MRVVDGIVGTGEVFLVASTAGLLAVALVKYKLPIAGECFKLQADKKDLLEDAGSDSRWIIGD